jgi:hypothetical protein
VRDRPEAEAAGHDELADGVALFVVHHPPHVEETGERRVEHAAAAQVEAHGADGSSSSPPPLLKRARDEGKMGHFQRTWGGCLDAGD